MPNVLDVYRGKITIKEVQYEMEIFDTSGDSQLGQDRQLMYHGADCFILCVAVSNKSINSLGEESENGGRLEIRNQLNQGIERFKFEARSVRANTPILLVGTKTDLRASDGNAITNQELKEV